MFKMKGKLFLAGGKNEEKLKEIDKFFTLKNILYIPIAWPNEDFNSCLKWFTDTINQNKKNKINMITDLTKKVELNNYDAVYIGGGNTFKLLKKIKESKFDKKLIDYFNNKGIIYGGSAGALILGYDIKTSLICVDKDKNEVGLKDTKGLNLIKNYNIQCHFEDNQIEEHRKFVEKDGRGIVCIPEESVLFFENENYKVIGLKPITVITKKEIKKYLPNETIKL